MKLHPDEAYANGELRSFARRRMRKTTERQKRLIENVLPSCRIDISTPQQNPARSLFGKKAIKEIWLEIGFGGGEHLVWQAENNKDVGFIGCEPFTDGAIKVLDAVEKQGLFNIKLYDDDARHVLKWLPAESLKRVFVLFPDPWPKKRHNKRRLLNVATLRLIANAMQPGGELRVATDIGDYARSILVAFQRSECFIWTAKTPRCWRVKPSDWPETRYERKALAADRRCYYFCFKKREANLNKP